MPDDASRGRLANIVTSLLHNIGVTVVGFGVAFLGVALDSLLHLPEFKSPLAVGAGLLLLAIGFLLRVWATYLFYERDMKVISLVPQKRLITTGPYRFSRNPLYLGGNVFIFFWSSDNPWIDSRTRADGSAPSLNEPLYTA